MQSLVALVFSGGFLGLSLVDDVELRRLFALIGLAVLLAFVIVIPLNLDVPVGDYHNYVQSVEAFEAYQGITEVQFQSHLGATLVGLIWKLLGRTEAHLGDAFGVYVVLASVVYFAALAALGFLERWSSASLRYISLATAAPALLLFFGYREYAFEGLALSVLAYPLTITGLEGPAWRIRAGASLLGLAAALHGYHLFGLLAGVLIVLLYDSPLRTRIGRALEVGIYGTAFYVAAIPIYLLIEKIPVTPGHTAAIPIRPLFEQKIAEHRYVHPILTSWEGFREVAVMYIAGGPPLMIPAALTPIARPLKTAVMIAAVPVMIFFAVFWPVQGIGNDTDQLGVFPVIFALAWLAAQSLRSTAVAWFLLAAGHIAFWVIVHPDTFVVGGELP